MAQTCFNLQVLRVRAQILTEIAPSQFNIFLSYASWIDKKQLIGLEIKNKMPSACQYWKTLINILLERKNFVLVKFYTCKPCTSTDIE